MTSRLRIPLLSAVAAGMVYSVGAFAQPERHEGPVEFMDPVTPAHVRVDMRRLPEPVDWQPGDPVKEMPDRKNVPRDYVAPDTAPRPVGEDPLRAIQNAVPSIRGGSSFDPPLINIEGSGFSGVNPPDTVGEVGLFHYVQMINGSGGTRVLVLDKTDGSEVTNFILSSLAVGSGTTCNAGTGDPIILFDQEVDNGPGEDKGRWLMTEFTSNSFCVYISETADFMDGGWFVYQFSSDGGGLPDYPKWAVWPDAYYVGANESRRLYAFDRENMLAGATTRPVQVFQVPPLSAFGFQMLQPADWDGVETPPAGTPAYFLRHRDDEAHNAGSNDPAADFVELWEFELDWDTPANSAVTGPINIEVEEFDSELCGFTAFACVPQPGSGTTLDPLREPVMWRAQYRNFVTHEVIVGSFVTDVDGSDLHGVRWFEFRRDGGSWELHQEGLVSPDDTHRWMPSIAMDGEGNMAVGYNVSRSTGVFPGLRYIGRLANDPVGTMPRGEVTLIDGTSPNGSNRYGDYSAMVVDPVDECTFWFTGEYNPASQWSTRIGSFKFDECGGFTVDPPSAGVCAADGSVDFTLTLGGLFEGTTDLSSAGEPAGTSGSFNPNPVVFPNVESIYTLSGLAGAAGGDYVLELTATDNVDPGITASRDVELTLYENTAGAVSLLAPADGSVDVDLQPEFSWDALADAAEYQIQVATDDTFTNVVIDELLADTSFTPDAPLASGTDHYWRVRGINACGDGGWSDEYQFQTRFEPVADVTPESFAFEVPQGGTDSDTLSITNSGTGNLTWEIATDQIIESAPLARSHDPALDEVFEIDDFAIDSPANGGSPEVQMVTAGVATRGDVVGFSFEGTVSGITGNSNWASDMCMIVESPDGATFAVGGFDGTQSGCDVNAWDFDGDGSTSDGTYASTHDDVFSPAEPDEGEWTFTFINDWDSASAATMNWTDVTVTLHKQPLPVCFEDLNEVPWLSASPDNGSTGAGATDEVTVTVDAAGMDAGEYEAYVCMTTNAEGQGVIPIPVELTVTSVPAPVAAVSPEFFDFEVMAGGADGGVLNVGNTGNADLEWMFTDSAPAECAWDTTLGNPGGSLNAMGLWGATLYVGGSSSSNFNGVSGGVAEVDLDTATVTPLGTTELVDGFVTSLLPYDHGNGERLYIVGAFNGIRFDGSELPDSRGVVAWDGSETVTLDGSPFAEPLVFAQAATVYGGQLVIGGAGGAIDPPQRPVLTFWDGSDWTVFREEFDGLVAPVILAVEEFNGDLYLAGRFASIEHPAGNVVESINIMGFDGEDFFSVGGGLERSTSIVSQVLAMKSFDDGSGEALYIGGRFDAAVDSGEPMFAVAKWDGTELSAVGNGFPMPNEVRGFEVYDDGNGPALYAVGNYTEDTVGAPISRVAKLEGGEWVEVAGGAGENPNRALSLSDGSLGFAGNFSDVGGASGVPGSGPSAGFAQLVCELEVACDDISQIPWLDVAPDAGITTPGGSEPVDILVDTDGLGAGDYEALLCLATNDPSASIVEVPVMLTVIPEPGELEVTPESVGFGGVAVGGTGAAVVTVSNAAEAGSADLELSQIEIIAGQDVFAIDASGSDCGETLAPQTSCTVALNYSPDALTAHNGVLRIVAEGKGTVNVSLSGNGVEAGSTIFEDRFEME